MGCRCSLHSQNADLIAGCSSFHNFKSLRMAPWESICSTTLRDLIYVSRAPLRPYAIIRMERVTKSLGRPPKLLRDPLSYCSLPRRPIQPPLSSNASRKNIFAALVQRPSLILGNARRALGFLRHSSCTSPYVLSGHSTTSMFPSTIHITVFGQSSVAASGLGECVPLKVDALLPSVALSLSVRGRNGASRATATAAMDGQVD